MASNAGFEIHTGCTGNFFEVGAAGHIVYVLFEKSGICAFANADSDLEDVQQLKAEG